MEREGDDYGGESVTVRCSEWLGGNELDGGLQRRTSKSQTRPLTVLQPESHRPGRGAQGDTFRP
jgi:hypothetical protein